METQTEGKKGSGVNILLVVIIMLLCGVIGFMGGKMLADRDNNTTDTSSTNEKENVLSDEEAMNIGKELFVKGFEEVSFTGWPETLSQADCKKAYDNAKKIFTKDAKVNYLGGYFENESEIEYRKIENKFYYNNQLSCAESARGGNIELMDYETMDDDVTPKIELSKKDANRIEFTYKINYCKDADFADSEMEKCLSKVQTANYKFIIEKENNEWKIAKISSVY